MRDQKDIPNIFLEIKQIKNNFPFKLILVTLRVQVDVTQTNP